MHHNETMAKYDYTEQDKLGRSYLIVTRIDRDKIIGLIICLLTAAVVVGMIATRRIQLPEVFRPGQTDMVGKPAPDFALRDLDGKEVKLADFKGKVVILDFWATWCPPCVKEIPHFIELYREYKEQDFAMVGISVDRGIGVVKSFAQQHQVNYPILMADGKVQQAYGGIRSIPTTFVTDKEGRIQRYYVGYRDKAVFEADIKALLAGEYLASSQRGRMLWLARFHWL